MEDWTFNVMSHKSLSDYHYLINWTQHCGENAILETTQYCRKIKHKFFQTMSWKQNGLFNILLPFLSPEMSSRAVIRFCRTPFFCSPEYAVWCHCNLIELCWYIWFQKVGVLYMVWLPHVRHVTAYHKIWYVSRSRKKEGMDLYSWQGDDGVLR